MENERMQRRHADRRIAAALQRVRETGSLSRSTAASRKVTLSRVRWMEGPEPSDPPKPEQLPKWPWRNRWRWERAKWFSSLSAGFGSQLAHVHTELKSSRSRRRFSVSRKQNRPLLQVTARRSKKRSAGSALSRLA